MSPSASAAPSGAPSDRVVLRVPADPAYLAVLRTATAGLAARLDLTLDEIEDLRIAVDEACALLLPGSRAADELTAVFDLQADALDVEVSGPLQPLPEPSSFAWAVLEALVGKVDTGTGDATSWIRLHHERANLPPAGHPPGGDEQDGRRDVTGAT